MTVKITFLPMNTTIEVDIEKMPYRDYGRPRSLLDVAMNHGIHLEHVCGGNCACTTCHLWVRKGEALISPMEDQEADRLELAADLQLNSRLGCQAVITKNEGEIVVEIPSWSRNCASEGSDSARVANRKDD